MNGIELMEIALRGGAATLCVTAAFLLFVRGRGQVAALTGGAFALASAIYIMTSLAAVHDALGVFVGAAEDHAVHERLEQQRLAAFRA